ncbi:DRTGG domain-containing protein [Sediminispirochaeta smaragdinae]|nr:DRTGG domain-containing protein [Sediminispirochaeta smaragdinae]
MKLIEIIDLVEGKVLCECGDLGREIESAFSSDLMSDVLTLLTDNMLLITGLTNIQAIRTAEMADIAQILFVRDKQPTAKMIELASETGICLITTRFSMFRASGILFGHGLPAVY